MNLQTTNLTLFRGCEGVCTGLVCPSCHGERHLDFVPKVNMKIQCSECKAKFVFREIELASGQVKVEII